MRRAGDFWSGSQRVAVEPHRQHRRRVFVRRGRHLRRHAHPSGLSKHVIVADLPQRSITPSRPAWRARSAASAWITPSCIQITLAPRAMAWSTISPIDRPETLDLFDSFEGLPPAQAIDGPHALAWQADTEGQFTTTTARLLLKALRPPWRCLARTE